MALDGSTRIIALRHGETAWNREARIQGHTDVPLNELGRVQAAALANALKDEVIAAVYSSDLCRASETASRLAAVVGLAVRQLPALRERSFGSLEGLSWSEIEREHPVQAERWRRRDPEFAVGGGESLNVFSARCVHAVLDLAASHPGDQIAIVSHGGVLDCLYRAASGLDLQATRAWPLGNATINRLLAVGPKLTLVGWNDDRHLTDLSVDESTA